MGTNACAPLPLVSLALKANPNILSLIISHNPITSVNVAELLVPLSTIVMYMKLLLSLTYGLAHSMHNNGYSHSVNVQEIFHMQKEIGWHLFVFIV